jgi:hypothetical protein
MEAIEIISHLQNIEKQLSQLTSDRYEKQFHNYALFACMACVKARYLINQEEEIMKIESKILSHIRTVYKRINIDAGKWRVSPLKVYSNTMREAKNKLQKSV